MANSANMILDQALELSPTERAIVAIYHLHRIPNYWSNRE